MDEKEFRTLYESDLKYKMLAGEPIEIESICTISPLIVREIVKCGYENYNRYLNCLTFSMEDLKEKNPQLQFEINQFDVYSATEEGEFRTDFESALYFFLKTPVRSRIYESVPIIILGEDESNPTGIIHRFNYPDLRNVIEAQNGRKDSLEKEYNAKKDKAREIAEKLNRTKKKVNQIKSNREDGEDIDLFDILSAVSTKSNSINKFNIWDLTMFQLLDEYRRLETIEQYGISIQSIMAGAKDVELKHWSSKI